MKVGLTALTIATIGTWAFFLLHNAGVLISIARLGSPAAGQSVAFMLVPAAGLAGAAWVGLLSEHRLSDAARVVIEALLLALGGFFIIVVMASRAG